MLSAFVLAFISVIVESVELVVLVQPLTSVAGGPLPLQPVVALTDDSGNILTTVNTGTVRAVIGASPSRFATVQPSSNSFPFVNGIAKLSDLYINLAGEGFTLVLQSLYHGVRAETAEFDIVVGDRYKLAIMADVSTAYGGTVFLPQPQVAVVDKGGNVVTVTNEGTVRLEIIRNPVGGLLLPATNLNVSIGSGLAKFQGVYIDVAGSPYTLRYTTSLVLEGGSTVDTNPFTVAAGACSTLILLSFPVEATSGKAFGIQPIVKLIDSGGNTLEEDSTSLVHVAISSNPSGGILEPTDLIKTPVRRGIAVFRGLNIDKAGNDYSLVFSLYSKNIGKTGWTKTTIEKISPLFNVLRGMPVGLHLIQMVSDGVLDGQPNEIQPIVALLDAGGNIVSTLSTGEVLATVVSSASVVSSIVVDTLAASILSITNVRASSTPQYPMPYGVGARLSIEVSFSDDVLATGAPALELATGNGGANGFAQCVTISTWSTTLIFQYDVVLTDSTTDLEYASVNALTIGAGSGIVDRNGNTPSLTLPALGSANSLSGTSSVIIDTTAPTITSVRCSSPGNGDYGTSERIAVEVVFSRFVTVYGFPFLPVVLTTIGNGDTSRNAIFAGGNNTNTLVFAYVVQAGDATNTLDVTSTINRNGGFIKHFSTRPTTEVDLTMVTSPNNLASLNTIRIDTATPVVDSTVGVTAITSNGVYAPGDEIRIAVTFTKLVAVTGFPRLFLETGNIKRPAGYASGHGTKVLIFVYKVSAYDTHSATGNSFLNYRDSSALDTNGGSITRLLQASSVGMGVTASLTLASATTAQKSLMDNAKITIDGVPPTVQSISVTSAPAVSVSRGDSVTIVVSFSARVVVNTTNGSPSIQMAVGEYNRLAVYSSGNETLALTFIYTVSLGDTAPLGIDYRSINALVLGGATIRRFSSSPTLDAFLTLPIPSLTLANPQVFVDRAMNTSTTILSVTVDVDPGEYGSNQVITFKFTFSDEVTVDGLAMFKINTGASVPYVAGSGTHELLFLHIVQDNEFTTNLDKLGDAAIECASPCRIINYNGQAASITLAGISVNPAGIAIGTRAPTVVRVDAITPAALVNDNTFVVGDEIDIVVEMSLEVYIDPPPTVYPEKAPQLILNSALLGRAVLCKGYLDEDDRRFLLFRYTVEDGDVASDLAYVSTDALTLNNDQCVIRRFSTTPTTDAELTLPSPTPLGSRLGQILHVNTTTVPAIASVTSITPNGLYRCGDVVTIVVAFTQHVSVQGIPFIWLDLGVNRRKAFYNGGSGSKQLTFVYTVGDDDYSTDLEYVDHHSLDTSADGTSILHQSTNPTTPANLDLPYPFTQGSLSFNKDIAVNGRRPRIISSAFLSPDGRYAVGDKLVMEVAFSACVVVNASASNTFPRLRFQPSRSSLTTIVRYGMYVGGSPGSRLRFEYTIQTGDTAGDLDYAGTDALEMNGAKILTCTSTTPIVAPVQSVDTHLNPPGGKLLGDTSKSIVFGRSTFTDLMVDRLGFKYRIEFETQFGAAILQSSSFFDVLYSSGYGLRSISPAIGDELGASVDVDGDTLIMGAPGAKQPASAVQIVTVTGDSPVFIDEIQVIQTRAVARPAVQVITSSAAPGETIGGWFQLSLGSMGVSRRLLYNFDAIQLRVALELDLGLGLESLMIAREANAYCACRYGFIWKITFLRAEGALPVLTVVNNMLTGRNATVGDGRGGTQANVFVESTVLSGFFTLQLASRVTRNIKYNVDEGELSTILTQDLGLAVRRVARRSDSLSATAMQAFTWQVTFIASDTLYDVPALIPHTEGLRGYGASCGVFTAREGQGRVSGTFRLRFRNDIFPTDITREISVSASDQDVEQALEQLVSINDVRVTRSSSMNAVGGYSWTITFVQVNTRNDYGPIVDTTSTLPALVAVTSMTTTTTVGSSTTVTKIQLLKGTNARVVIQVGGFELAPLAADESFWGFAGDRAGMAAVFIRAENDWKQQGGNLVGSDTREGDLFGTSVSLRGELALVGAPSAVSFGDFERQHFYCDADGGFFRLVYRGFQSTAIAFNAASPVSVLQNAIANIMSITHGDVDVAQISSVGGGAMCAQTLFEITLKAGDLADSKGNIPELTVDTSHLTKTAASAVAEIREFSVGTFKSDGGGAMGLQCGAAYLFARSSSAWTQKSKLLPPASLIQNVSEFGETVSVLDTFAAVGAPGAFYERGRVFVYQFSAVTSSWALFQTLSAAPFDTASGDRFGQAISMSKSTSGTVTLAVGAPGYAEASGAVFIFDLRDGYFQNRQFMLRVTDELRAGDRFGCSVDLDMVTTFTLVVGAERSALRDGKDSGIAVVFTRRTSTDTFFVLQQVLYGSDTRRGDRFGSEVAISKDTIMVGAHEFYDGPRTIRKAVQAITTSTAGLLQSGIVLAGGSFAIGAMTGNMTAGTAVEQRKRITTRDIPFNVDGPTLQAILETDMPFGNVIVKRKGPDDGMGYTWYVTFIAGTSDLPLLEVDPDDLVLVDSLSDNEVELANNSRRTLIATVWVVRVPPVLRSNAYLFTRDRTGVWTEQATLFPREKQYFSWFGSAVALDGRTAVVGAPNLDTYVSGLNSGGGFVFDIRILSLGFSSKTYSVVEGRTLDLTVQRCSFGGGFCAIDTTSAPQMFINYDTGDAYSNQRSINYVDVVPHIGPYKKLAMLEAVPYATGAFFASDVVGQEPYPQVSHGRWLMAAHVSSATGRDQFYGSTDRRSQWIDANYDYAGLSDYSTSSDELFFDVNDNTKTFSIATTGDLVLEDPDETITVRLSLPGIWPSATGNLWSAVTIKDDGDGGSGARSSLEFLTAGTNNAQKDSAFSSAVAVFHDGNVAVVGAPMEKQTLVAGGIVEECGAAYLYVKRSGFWELESRVAPSAPCTRATRFGASVAIDGSLGVTRAIIGAPGLPGAYIYRRVVTASSVSWLQDARLADPLAKSLTHSYAGSNAVAIYGDIAVVGASGLEAVFVYHRGASDQWALDSLLRCSDRRVVRILEQYVEQDYDFGRALALDARTLVVGAPFADGGAFTDGQYYDRSFDKYYFGVGAAYVFHIQAQEQLVQLRTDNPLTGGSFCLTATYRGVTATTKAIYYNATAASLQSAIQELPTIRLVQTSRSGTAEQGFTWRITFVGEVLSVPVLVPSWRSYGCFDCDAFSSTFKSDPGNQVQVQEVTSLGAWTQQARLQAPDANAGDQFGASVSISGEQVIVGAARSSALASTTWNFETGDLTGWMTTGTAFDAQPTFGDNAYARVNIYKPRPPSDGSETVGQRARHEGRYWVGTYESRSGAGKKTVLSIITPNGYTGMCAFASDQLCRAPNYKFPGTDPSGTYQGDGPQGSMTSQAFTILGSWLSFRIGGGCDLRVVYAELLIDGVSVQRATGMCEETMREVTWDLSEYQNRTARIRVVDASSSAFWGHINFDDVRFSWGDYVAQASTSKAGIAYTFRRRAPNSLDACANMNRRLCEWEFQARLSASDKRTEDAFGFAVAVDDDMGIAAIAAPGQSGVDANNTIIGSYKHGDHGSAAFEAVGSVYIFRRIDEVRDGKGVLLAPPKWEPKEVVKLQYPNKQDQSRFGSALALDKLSLIVGSPWFSTSPLTVSVGQAFYYDAGLATVAFTSNLFSCMEDNTDRIASLTIARFGGNISEPLTVGYATEDLTAYGIDANKYADCMTMPATLRDGCFDYQQTAGQVTFAAGETSKQLLVPIVDDTCYEHWDEYFIVRLNVPGGEALLGENFVARVRIDDDDFGNDPC